MHMATAVQLLILQYEPLLTCHNVKVNRKTVQPCNYKQRQQQQQDLEYGGSPQLQGTFTNAHANSSKKMVSGSPRWGMLLRWEQSAAVAPGWAHAG
jgi:hypothetical protein